MVPTALTPVPAPTVANRFTVRPLESGDFAHLQRLEKEIWSEDPIGMLCPFYLRLCTEHYADWCFMVFEGERPIGYVLNFPRDKVNYCATLAVHPEFQKSKANYLLLRAMIVKLLQEDMEECRFLVEPDNMDARSVHETLGARVVGEVHDFYHEGDTRLWSVINKDDLERIRAKYTKLRLVCVNFVSTPFPASSSLESDPRRPISLISRFGRMASVLAATAWAAMRVGMSKDPNLLMHRWAISILESLRVRVEIQGELDSWPQLWIANHLSWLDPLVLMSLRPMGAMAKHEVSRYPLIGYGSRKTGLIFVDRADPTNRAAALVRLVAELRRGKAMLLFPEGTTTRGHRLAPLQEGGLRAAYRSATPIQTIRLFSKDPSYPWIGDDDLLPHILNIVKAGQTRVSVQAGAVLEPWQFPTETSWIDAIQRELIP